MDDFGTRRRVLKQLVAVAGTLMLPAKRAIANSFLAEVPREWEIQIFSFSEHALRLSVPPLKDGRTTTIPLDGSLVQAGWKAPVAILRGDWRSQTVKAGGVVVHVSPMPLSFTIENKQGERVQQLTVDRDTGVVLFEAGKSPMFGLGEGADNLIAAAPWTG
jgi:hypothetical protein